MKKKQLLLILVAALVVVVAAIFVLNRPPAPPAPSPLTIPQRAGPPPVAPTPTPAPEAPAPAPAAPVPPPPETKTTIPEGVQPVPMILVKPDAELAVVNGVTITLKDLVPVSESQAGQERPMTAEVYDSLLNRAIERELTIEAARAQGVTLTDDQKKQLAEIMARNQQSPEAILAGQREPATVEFQQRDFTATMLQANLAAKAGLPALEPTPEQVESYYQEHKAEYGELPADPAARDAAWQKIDRDIRQKLFLEHRAASAAGLRKLIEQLKTNAKITINPP